MSVTLDIEKHHEVLPPLYERWIHHLLGESIPHEARATCNQCAMLPTPGEEKSHSNEFFDPAVKCCTYIPSLPNFLAGSILRDADPATEFGKVSLLKRVEERLAVSPLGVGKSPVFSLLYQNSQDAFGHSRSLRCPHYVDDKGTCSIWRHRESTCATWFCKHVRGATGFNFWRHSLQPLLAQIESELSWWCVLEVGISGEELRELHHYRAEISSVDGYALDNKFDSKSYVRIWGLWVGREKEFFIECAELVENLSWAEVVRICSPGVRALAQLTVDAYRQMSCEELPDELEIGSMQLVRISRGTARVNTYSQYDPLDLPYSLIELLSYFECNTTEQALAQIESEKDIRLDRQLVRKLIDFSLLRKRGSSRDPEMDKPGLNEP